MGLYLIKDDNLREALYWISFDLRYFSDIEKIVFEMYYKFGYSTKEIAKYLNLKKKYKKKISESRVKQIIRKIKKKAMIVTAREKNNMPVEIK